MEMGGDADGHAKFTQDAPETDYAHAQRLHRKDLPCLSGWHYHLVRFTRKTPNEHCSYPRDSLKSWTVLLTEEIYLVHNRNRFPQPLHLHTQNQSWWLKSQTHSELASTKKGKTCTPIPRSSQVHLSIPTYIGWTHHDPNPTHSKRM